MKKIREIRSETYEQSKKIIKNHALWAMGGGALPMRFVDLAAVTAVQLDMLKKLCQLYDVDYSENQGKNIVTALTGGFIARSGAGIVKSIPIVGFFFGGITMSLLSGAITFGVGHVFVNNFENGNTLFDINMTKSRKIFQTAFVKGKEYANEWKKRKKDDEVIKD